MAGNKVVFATWTSQLNKIKDLIRFKINLASESNDGRRTNNYLEIVENEKTASNNLNSYQNKE